MNSQSVAAVIVTYFPNKETLLSLVNSLSSQVKKIIIVDNGSNLPLEEWLGSLEDCVEVISLNENLGVASAQNIGIKNAQELKVKYVALFDQDSNIDETYIGTLTLKLETLLLTNKKVAAVGPNFLDQRQNNPVPFLKIEGYSLKRLHCNNNEDIVPVDYLISSGLVIPLETIEVVGYMEEKLFIDYIDLEWGERAKSKGYQTYGVCAAKMLHSLGDEPITFLGKSIPNHNPLRHYYMTRNAIWMYRQSWIRKNWKVVDGIRLVRKIVFYTIFAKPQFHHFGMMMLGIYHGIIGKMGRYHPARI